MVACDKKKVGPKMAPGKGTIVVREIFRAIRILDIHSQEKVREWAGRRKKKK